jgi:hypothetical protein
VNDIEKSDIEKSRVFYNPDGYVEVVLAGSVQVGQMRVLAEAARALIEQQGPAGGLIDGRRGRIVSNMEMLTLLRSLQTPSLKRLVILTTGDNPAGIQGPDLALSILTAVFGIRPVYSSDEAEARRLAAL